MGYPKGKGAGRNGKNFVTLAQYFAIGKAHRKGTAKEGGTRECRVREAGSSEPLFPPPPTRRRSKTTARHGSTTQLAAVSRLKGAMSLGARSIRQKISGLKFRTFHVTNGALFSGCSGLFSATLGQISEISVPFDVSPRTSGIFG